MSLSKIACDICEYVTKTNKTYGEHRMSHIGTKPFFCIDCSEGFLSEPNYYVHLSQHNGSNEKIDEFKKKYVCNICEIMCSSMGELAKHYLDHLIQINIKCDDCKLYFMSEKDYAIHQHLHQKDFTCKVCSCDFQTKAEILGHVVSHSPHKYFKKFTCAYQPKRISEKTVTSVDKNVKLKKNSKILKISPSLFGANLHPKKNLSDKFASVSSLNFSKESFGEKSEKNLKTSAFFPDKDEINVVNHQNLCNQFCYNSYSKSVQATSEKLFMKTDVKKNNPSALILQPNSKSFIDKNSSRTISIRNSKMGVKRSKYSSFTNKSQCNVLKYKQDVLHFLPSGQNKLISNSKNIFQKSVEKQKTSQKSNLQLIKKTSDFNDLVIELKQCSVVVKKLPFYVKDYKSYQLFLKSHRYPSRRSIPVSEINVMKHIKQLEIYFQDNIRALTLLKVLKNIYEKSMVTENNINLFLYKLCCIYYDTFLKSGSNIKNLNYKSNSNGLDDSDSNMEKTILFQKNRIQKIKRSLNIINCIKQVKKKCVKVLLHRLPDIILNKFLKDKPIMLSNVIPDILQCQTI